MTASVLINQSNDFDDLNDEGAASSSLPRFNLRKRTVSDTETTTAPSIPTTFSSSFLSGIFTDINSKSASNDDNNCQQEDCHYPIDSDEKDTTNHPSPSKKSRISLTRSISRSAKSYKNLAFADSTGTEMSSTGSFNFFDGPAMRLQNEQQLVTPVTPNGKDAIITTDCISRHNSLTFQLNCVSSSSSNNLSTSEPTGNQPAKLDICKLAFPRLPATVSDQDLTQMLSSRQSSDTTKKETYGWFVDLDDQDSTPPPPVSSQDPYASKSSSDMAFSIPTAPNANANHDAEVEWAKAADTVDDVLGDFF